MTRQDISDAMSSWSGSGAALSILGSSSPSTSVLSAKYRLMQSQLSTGQHSSEHMLTSPLLVRQMSLQQQASPSMPSLTNMHAALSATTPSSSGVSAAAWQPSQRSQSASRRLQRLPSDSLRAAPSNWKHTPGRMPGASTASSSHMAGLTTALTAGSASESSIGVSSTHMPCASRPSTGMSNTTCSLTSRTSSDSLRSGTCSISGGSIASASTCASLSVIGNTGAEASTSSKVCATHGMALHIFSGADSLRSAEIFDNGTCVHPAAVAHSDMTACDGEHIDAGSATDAAENVTIEHGEVREELHDCGQEVQHQGQHPMPCSGSGNDLEHVSPPPTEQPCHPQQGPVTPMLGHTAAMQLACAGTHQPAAPGQPDTPQSHSQGQSQGVGSSKKEKKQRKTRKSKESGAKASSASVPAGKNPVSTATVSGVSRSSSGSGSDSKRQSKSPATTNTATVSGGLRKATPAATVPLFSAAAAVGAVLSVTLPSANSHAHAASGSAAGAGQHTDSAMHVQGSTNALAMHPPSPSLLHLTPLPGYSSLPLNTLSLTAPAGTVFGAEQDACSHSHISSGTTGHQLGKPPLPRSGSATNERAMVSGSASSSSSIVDVAGSSCGWRNASEASGSRRGASDALTSPRHQPGYDGSRHDGSACCVLPAVTPPARSLAGTPPRSGQGTPLNDVAGVGPGSSNNHSLSGTSGCRPSTGASGLPTSPLHQFREGSLVDGDAGIGLHGRMHGPWPASSEELHAGHIQAHGLHVTGGEGNNGSMPGSLHHHSSGVLPALLLPASCHLSTSGCPIPMGHTMGHSAGTLLHLPPCPGHGHTQGHASSSSKGAGGSMGGSTGSAPGPGSRQVQLQAAAGAGKRGTSSSSGDMGLQLGISVSPITTGSSSTDRRTAAQASPQRQHLSRAQHVHGPHALPPMTSLQMSGAPRSPYLQAVSSPSHSSTAHGGVLGPGSPMGHRPSPTAGADDVAAAGGGAAAAGLQQAAATSDSLNHARKAKERLDAYRRAAEERARAVAAAESAKRAAVADARAAGAAAKERRRAEVYALNAILERCDAARVQALVVAMASQGKPFPPCHTSITAAVQQPTIAPSGSGEAAALPACKEGQDKGCCTEGVDACTAGASADVGMAVPPASIVLPHGPRPCSVMSTASDATDSSMPDGWFRHGV